jgi:hypothetical protein
MKDPMESENPREEVAKAIPKQILKIKARKIS